MPIRPEMRARYPANWPEIRAAVGARSGWRCEWCGVRHRDVGWRDPDGTFHWAGRALLDAGCKPGDSVACSDGRTIKLIRIILTVAHVHDHRPENCDMDNLAHLCQRCHNRHDAKMRSEGRKQRTELEGGQHALQF